mmetsp:Transcript_45301/g.109670  ORF Transcript_45301/g.109670 Transcript_45301/m.109670 type:complete len:212 (-) Transcript_45301:52-687(-)
MGDSGNITPHRQDLYHGIDPHTSNAHCISFPWLYGIKPITHSKTDRYRLFSCGIIIAAVFKLVLTNFFDFLQQRKCTILQCLFRNIDSQYSVVSAGKCKAHCQQAMVGANIGNGLTNTCTREFIVCVVNGVIGSQFHQMAQSLPTLLCSGQQGECIISTYSLLFLFCDLIILVDRRGSFGKPSEAVTMGLDAVVVEVIEASFLSRICGRLQ